MIEIITKNLRTDCYLAILDKKKIEFPYAHFEIITRSSQSVLSPSYELLCMYKAGMIFETYKIALIEEINRSEKAQKRLRELKQIALNKVVFLVCFEKDVNKCHRSLIKQLILEI